MRRGKQRITRGLEMTMLVGAVTFAMGIVGCVADQTKADEQATDKAESLVPAEEAGWELFFEDDFDREELGDDWEVVDGKWTIEDGDLRGSGTLMTGRGFPASDQPSGFQRLEFTAVTDVKSLDFLQVGNEKSETRISDLSSFIHATSPEESDKSALQTGYFFQFGGFWNSKNKITKGGSEVAVEDDPETTIKTGEEHHVVVQNDEGNLEFFVDGKRILEHSEKRSILGPKHNRVGFYFYTAAKVKNVKVYVKQLPDGLDLGRGGAR